MVDFSRTRLSKQSSEFFNSNFAKTSNYIDQSLLKMGKLLRAFYFWDVGDYTTHTSCDTSFTSWIRCALITGKQKKCNNKWKLQTNNLTVVKLRTNNLTVVNLETRRHRLTHRFQFLMIYSRCVRYLYRTEDVNFWWTITTWSSLTMHELGTFVKHIANAPNL